MPKGILTVIKTTKTSGRRFGVRYGLKDKKSFPVANESDVAAAGLQPGSEVNFRSDTDSKIMGMLVDTENIITHEREV